MLRLCEYLVVAIVDSEVAAPAMISLNLADSSRHFKIVRSRRVLQGAGIAIAAIP